jgi:hypothetical protein
VAEKVILQGTADRKNVVEIITGEEAEVRHSVDTSSRIMHAKIGVRARMMGLTQKMLGMPYLPTSSLATQSKVEERS